MSDLRERLASAKFRHIDEEGAEWDAVEIIDAILVVAVWLRDKAAQSEKYAARDLTGMEFAAAWRLNALADEIDPPKVGTDGG